MKILAIETSSSLCSVALKADNQIYCEEQIAPMQHASLILPMIDRLLKNANISLNQLDAIAFGCGPGSFTGVRIAASVIQGLAYATSLPVIPISSLAATAQTAADQLQWPTILVAVDARINEIYWATYKTQSDGLVKLVDQENLSSPKALTETDKFIKNECHGVGNAWEIYQNLMPALSKIDTVSLPSASAVLKLAEQKFKRNEWVSAKDALPVYLRDEVAKKANS